MPETTSPADYYHNSGAWCALFGDCRDRLDEIPDGSVDLTLTDPPYGMDFQSGHRKNKYQKILGDSGNIDWVYPIVEKLFAKQKDNTGCLFFCSHHRVGEFKEMLENAGFRALNLCVWVKNATGMGDLQGNFAPKHELCWFAVKGRPLLRGGRPPNVWEYSRTGNKYHPTEKPTDLLAFLVGALTDQEALVLDPFGGSMSTGVACHRTGRRFVGIERDPNIYQTGLERLLWLPEWGTP